MGGCLSAPATKNDASGSVVRRKPLTAAEQAEAQDARARAVLAAEARQAKHDASPYGKAVKKQQASEKAAAAAAAGGTGKGGPDARDWLS